MANLTGLLIAGVLFFVFIGIVKPAEVGRGAEAIATFIQMVGQLAMPVLAWVWGLMPWA